MGKDLVFKRFIQKELFKCKWETTKKDYKMNKLEQTRKKRCFLLRMNLKQRYKSIA